MAKKRSAELDAEIREALSRIPKKTLKTRPELEAEIDAILAGGLAAERYEVARALGYQYPKRPPPKKMTITHTNIFALTELVLDGGGRSTFSNRLQQTDYPHIKRTLAAGLVTVSSPTTLTLTPQGREVVLRELRENYARGTLGHNRGRSLDPRTPEQYRAAIENLEAGG